jgi:hypothetical protein
MNFSVLPVAGGLYDQHPALLEQWEMIMSAEAAEEKKKQDREARKNKPGMGASLRRPRSRRR